MEQAIEESVEAEDVEVRENPNQVDDNEIDYKRRESEKGFKYKSNAKEVFSRNSLKRSDLEGKISNWRKGARELGKDETEYVSLKLAQRPIFYSGNSDEERESEQDKDTENGSVMIVSYINPENGRLEFLVEQKPVTYPVAEARGKFSFIGGSIKTNESDLEAAIREAGEEVSEPAASIIIRELRKNPQIYDKLTGSINGKSAYTVIWEVKITSRNEWEILKYASMSEGIPRVLTDEDAIKYNNYFAFGYGPVIKEFISEKLGIKDPSPYIKFIPFTYKDSFIPNYYSSPKSTSLVSLSMNQK